MSFFMRSGLVMVSLLVVVVLVSCSGGNSTAKGVVTVSASIGPAGGTLVSGDGFLMLDIPAGALMTTELITITQLSPNEMAPELAALNAGQTYRLEPDGLTFLLPVTASLDSGIPEINTTGMVRAGLVVPIVASGGVVEALEEIVNEVDVENDSMTVRGELGHFSQISSFRSGELGDDFDFFVQYPSTIAGGQTGVVIGEISKTALVGATTGPVTWRATTSTDLSSNIENVSVFSSAGFQGGMAETLMNGSVLGCLAVGPGNFSLEFAMTLDAFHSDVDSINGRSLKFEFKRILVNCLGMTGGTNLPYSTPQLFPVPPLTNLEAIRMSKDTLPCANLFSAVVAGQGGAAQIDLATGTITDIFNTGAGVPTFDALTFPMMNPGDDAGLLHSGQGLEMKRIGANCVPGAFSQLGSGIYLDASYNGQFATNGAHLAGPGVITRVGYQPLSQGWEFQDTNIPVGEIPIGLRSVMANAAGDKFLAVGQFELRLIDGTGPSATSTSAFPLGSNARRVRWDPSSGFGGISDLTDNTIIVFQWDGQVMPVMTDVVSVGDGPVGIDIQGNRIASAGFNDNSYTIIELDANGQATQVNTSPSPFTSGGMMPGHIIFLGDPDHSVAITFNGDSTIGVIPNAY